MLGKLIRCDMKTHGRVLLRLLVPGGAETDFTTLYDSGVQEYVVVTE